MIKYPIIQQCVGFFIWGSSCDMVAAHCPISEEFRFFGDRRNIKLLVTARSNQPLGGIFFSKRTRHAARESRVHFWVELLPSLIKWLCSQYYNISMTFFFTLKNSAHKIVCNTALLEYLVFHDLIL